MLALITFISTATSALLILTWRLFSVITHHFTKPTSHIVWQVGCKYYTSAWWNGSVYWRWVYRACVRLHWLSNLSWLI